jgi:allantoicase
MLRAVDQGTIERAADDASDGPANNRKSDGWCERRIREQKTDRRMVQAMEHSVIEGAMVAASD